MLKNRIWHQKWMKINVFKTACYTCLRLKSMDEGHTNTYFFKILLQNIWQIVNSSFFLLKKCFVISDQPIFIRFSLFCYFTLSSIKLNLFRSSGNQHVQTYLLCYTLLLPCYRSIKIMKLLSSNLWQTGRNSINVLPVIHGIKIHGLNIFLNYWLANGSFMIISFLFHQYFPVWLIQLTMTLVHQSADSWCCRDPDLLCARQRWSSTCRSRDTLCSHPQSLLLL